MNNTTVNKFRENLKSYVDQVVENHETLRVTRRNGDDFMVISADDWEREQETLYVLQNNSLMQQIADSFVTHGKGEGYKVNEDQLNEIIDL